MSDLGDVFDRATDREMADREAAISAARLKLVESHPDFDGKNCLDCELAIPELRLMMHKIRCVFCQEILEKRHKFYGS